jgi:hypothetical protein
MPPSLPSLARPEGDNFGGLLALQLFKASHVVRIPDHDGVILAQSIQLQSGITLAGLYFTPGTATFSEDPADTDQGEIFKWKISFSVPKTAPDIHYWLQAQRGHELMAIVLDGNSNPMLIGNPDYTLKLKADVDTGNQPAKKNGYGFTLSGEGPDRALFYLLYESLLPPPRKVFSSGFTYGFLRTP